MSSSSAIALSSRFKDKVVEADIVSFSTIVFIYSVVLQRYALASR